jgi:hypothetical protein
MFLYKHIRRMKFVKTTLIYIFILLFSVSVSGQNNFCSDSLSKCSHLNRKVPAKILLHGS